MQLDQDQYRYFQLRCPNDRYHYVQLRNRLLRNRKNRKKLKSFKVNSGKGMSPGVTKTLPNYSLMSSTVHGHEVLMIFNPSLNSREDYVLKFRFFDDFFVQFGSEVFTVNYNCHCIMPMHYNEHLGVI